MLNLTVNEFPKAILSLYLVPKIIAHRITVVLRLLEIDSRREIGFEELVIRLILHFDKVFQET